MAVRKTEQRLPAGVTPAELGQAQGDARAALVSYHSSPTVVGRQQTYVVFVLDTALQSSVASYHWDIGSDTQQTDAGVLVYAPTAEGDIDVNVSLRDGADTELVRLSLHQEVVPLNPELETMIAASDQVAPVAADPETSRELVNDVRVYIDDLAPRSADPDSSLNKLIFALAYAEAMAVPPADRTARTARMADALDQAAAASFVDQAEAGIGLCQLRPQVLGMFVSATPGGTDWLIAPREFPHDEDARATLQTALKNDLAQLDEARRVDLFNLLRFPKSNLRMAIQLTQALMAQYLPGDALPAILADETKAKTLIAQFQEGPFALT